MKIKVFAVPLFVLLLAPLATIAQPTQTAIELRQGVPQDAHLAIYGKNNPERAYQQEHLAKVWQTFQEEQIAERFFKAVTSQVSDEKIDEARSVWEQVRSALDPIDCDVLLNADEVVYAQVMVPPFNHHLVLVRTTPSSAAELQRGFEQLFDLFSEWSEGKVSKALEQTEKANFVMLDLPNGVPMRPVLARVDDIVIFSSSEEIVKQSLEMLLDEKSVSKFDDPRFAEALAELPDPEDAIVIFDGKLLFEKLHGIANFIREQSPEGNQEVERWTRIFEHVLDEVAIFDYEVAVEYTEGQQNRVAAIGKLLPNAKDKLLYQAVTQGQPFEDWQAWVPADATAYSLNTGINLHVIYERIMKCVREEFPESHEPLDRFEAKQREIDFHLDRDLFQSFSGESVSVTVPIESSDGSTTQFSVTALRCQNSERIQELLSRAVELLATLPPVQAQQLQLVECEELEGFREVQAAILNVFGARPVFGFHDGWMVFSSNREAVAKVLATRKGEAAAISQSDSFRKFGLQVAGPVHTISYTDVGAAVRQTADSIEQVGAIAPMFVGMMAAQADPERLQPVQELIGLLPSVAKVIREFDFIEHQLTVVREGSQPDTYRRDGVWLIRAAENKSSAE